MGALGHMGQEPPRVLGLLLGVLFGVLLSAGRPCTAGGVGAEPQPSQGGPDIAVRVKERPFDRWPSLVEWLQGKGARGRQLIRLYSAQATGAESRFLEGGTLPASPLTTVTLAGARGPNGLDHGWPAFSSKFLFRGT